MITIPIWLFIAVMILTSVVFWLSGWAITKSDAQHYKKLWESVMRDNIVLRECVSSSTATMAEVEKGLKRYDEQKIS